MNYRLLYPGFKTKALTFSYDDGIRQDLTLVPLLKKYGFKGTFNLNYGQSGEKKIRQDINGEDVDCSHLVLEDSIHLYDGMEVASHTYDHPFMNYLPYEEQYEEYKKDIEGLESLFHTKIHGGAYPFGTFNEDSLKAQKANGLQYSRTTRSTYAFSFPVNPLILNPTIHHNDPKLEETVDAFFRCEDELALCYIWGHAYEFALQHNFRIIDDLGKRFKGHDEVYMGTNWEILSYVNDAYEVFYYLDRRVGEHYFVNDSESDVYLITEKGDKLIIPKKGRVRYEG